MTYTNKRGIIARKGFLNGKKTFSRQETPLFFEQKKQSRYIEWHFLTRVPLFPRSVIF